LHPIHGYVRWSGPGTVSSLRFDLKKGVDFKVRFKIVNAAAADILASLSIRVNEIPITLVRLSEVDPNQYIFEGIIPGSVIEQSKGSTQIDFVVNRTVYPSETDPLNVDQRALSICYNWLEIIPHYVDSQ
jgi:hypothetical protein